ncbi:hypothetical protein B4U79_11068 [Dinothrombium tinctorium]|uniref:Uncharacterized protein n=1 Tax=Dinothrombium tinctorium TaxID=1965070 RepID=A0A443QAQ3_9ACAR|nr:hypothetical protein B4U79_09128 [Dinothrombium tinctorium]RWS00258.1 hypothetical protein B4U79_00369 [Dinothrombium tinctorium]RWS02066.1 hypothetical protein B4U79_11068 [Dinothrombium tinctorium]
MIPLMSWSFFIGRLAFMIGYPLHREFGFLLSFLPNTAALFYCVYKFIFIEIAFEIFTVF